MKTVEGKVVILGAQGVGKTSVVTRYVAKSYTSHVSPTIGASFVSCKIHLEDLTVKLQVWDTAGQERFRSMAPMYYRNANAAILVFDLTNRQSFVNIKSWVQELRGMVTEPIYICVVGNKTDLENDRKVDRDEATQYSKSIGGTYFESSALTNEGIEQLFLNIATCLIKLSGENMSTTLKTYDSEAHAHEGNTTDLKATDIGNTEVPSWSIDSIAHADTERPHMCC